MAKPLLIGLDGLEDGQSFNQTKYRMKNIYCKILNSTLDVNLTKSRATNLLEVLNYGEKVLFGQIAVDYKKQFANDVKNGINESCRREWGRRKLTNEIETLSDNFAMQNRFSNLQLKAGNKFDSVFEFIGNLVGVKKYTRAELTKELLRKKQEKKYYKDTEYVEYTKKYKINYDFISSEDLINLEKNPAIAYEQIVKEKVWTPYDVQKLKDDGNTSGAAFYKVKLREYVQKRPANNKISRLLYVKGIEFLRNWLEDKKNLDDIVAYNTDYKRVPLFKKQLEELLENELTNEVVRIANISPNKTNINEEIPGSFRDYNTNAIFGKQFDYIINNADYGNEYVLRFYQNLRKADEKNLDWEENWDWADKYLDKTKKVTKKETTEDEGADKIEVSEKRLPLQHIVRKGGLKVTDDMITTEFIQKEFLYKNVIFGNYVNDRFSKQFVKYFIASMLDLGEILDLNISAINKSAGLSISFGSMGGGSKAVASYFPNHKTINLTKSKGDGSIAHEWAHYLDNILEDGDLITGTPKFATDSYKIKEVRNFLSNVYFSHKEIRENYKLLFFPGYISKNYTARSFARQFFLNCKNLDEAIEKFKSYFRRYPGYGEFTIGDKKQTNYNKKNLDFYLAAGAYISKEFNNSKMVCIEADSHCSYMFRDAFYADLSKSKKYWTTPKEMFARAFECMVLQKLKKAGRENNYLIRVNKEGKDYSPDKDVFPWLVEKEDIEAIEPAFDELINMLREKFGSFQTSLTERENETTTLSDSFAMQNRNEFSMLYKYLDLEKKANGRFQNVFKFLRKITRIFTKEELDEEALKLKREKRKEWELRTGRDYIPTSKPNEFGNNYDLFGNNDSKEYENKKVDIINPKNIVEEKENKQENIEYLKNKVNEEIFNGSIKAHEIYQKIKRKKQKVIELIDDFELKVRAIFDKYNLEVEDYYEDYVANIDTLIYDIAKKIKKDDNEPGIFEYVKNTIHYLLNNDYKKFYRIKSTTLSDSFAKNVSNRYYQLKNIAVTKFKNVMDFAGKLIGFSQKNILKGKDCKIITSSKKIGGYYAIYEIDFLIPSNDPFTFAPIKNYPKGCQTRNYSEDKPEQEKVALYSSEFLPGHLLNNSLDATTGPPIVLPEGVVLGGNGRSMVINRVAEQNKGAYSEYVNELKETAVIYGFKKNDIARFKKPVLVRVIEAPINESITYSNILNSNTTQNYDEVREGIAVALQLEQKPHILNQLAQALEESEAESLSEMLDDRKIAGEIINILTREGILNITNMSKLINLQANTFTQLGVVFVKVLLIGSILPDKKLIENAENYVNKIIKALPSVLRLRTLPAEWNLIPQIREVVKLETKRRARGIKSIQAYIMQDDAFESKPEPLTIELWRILNDVGINDFKNLLRFYVERAKEQGESSIFAEPSEPIVVLANWKDFNEKRKQKQTDERRLKQEWSEKHGN